MYQGHHTDGSGVQKHSVGNIYPYVIRIREIANNNGGWDRTHELLHPSGEVTSHSSHDEAWSAASAAIIARRQKGAAEDLANTLAPFAPLIRSGVTTLNEVVDLIRSVNGAKCGLPISRKDQVRYDVLVGFANQAKAAGQRSARESLIIA